MLSQDRLYMSQTALKRRYDVNADSTIYDWLRNDSSFPRPFKIGKKNFYLVHEIEAWEQKRIAARLAVSGVSDETRSGLFGEAERLAETLPEDLESRPGTPLPDELRVVARALGAEVMRAGGDNALAAEVGAHLIRAVERRLGAVRKRS